MDDPVMLWRGEEVPIFRAILDLGEPVHIELPTRKLIHLATHLKDDFIIEEIETGIQIKMAKVHSHKFSHIGYLSDQHVMYLIDKEISMSRYKNVPERVYRQIRASSSPRKTFAKYVSRSYRGEVLV